MGEREISKLYRYTILCRGQGAYGYGATPEEAKKHATQHYRKTMGTRPIRSRVLERLSVDGSYSFVEVKRRDEKTGKLITTKYNESNPS